MAPASCDVLLLIANGWRLQGQAGRAVTLLSALALLQPTDAAVLRALAAAQLADARAAPALSTLDALALAGGADGVFHLLRAQAMVALDRPREAAAAMHAALEAWPAAGADARRPA